MAPGVTLSQCIEDLKLADADRNHRITEQEFFTFLQYFGERVCYYPESKEFSDNESSVFDAFVCLASKPCDGLTEIVVAEPSFSSMLAYVMCTISYTNVLNEATCDELPISVGPSCQNSTSLSIPWNIDWPGYRDSGTNMFLEFEPKNGPCPVIQRGARSKYYMVPGNERCFEASTYGSDFDTVLAVYMGDSCDEQLICHAQNDDFGFQSPNGTLAWTTASKVSFTTEFDTNYWIVVAGFEDSVGNFELSLWEIDCPANHQLNTECAAAVEVSPPGEYTASFDFLPLLDLNNALEDCPSNELLGTLWYKVGGDGSCLKAKVSIDQPHVEVPFVLVEEFSDCKVTGCPLAFSARDFKEQASEIQ